MIKPNRRHSSRDKNCYFSLIFNSKGIKELVDNENVSMTVTNTIIFIHHSHNSDLLTLSIVEGAY